MESLRAIISASWRFALRGWLILIPLLILRSALAITAFFPWIFATAIMVRSYLGAPTGTSGQSDPLIWFQAIMGDTRSVVLLSAILAGIWLLKLVLASLIDAGLCGEIARAVKQGRDLSLEGFISAALDFFGRIVSLRLLAGFFLNLALFGMLSLAVLIIRLSMPVQNSFGDEMGLLFGGISGLLLLSFSATFLVAGILFLCAIAAAVTIDDLPLSAAMRSAWAMLREKISTMLVLLVFFLMIFLAWSALSFLGGLWWIKLTGQRPSVEWPALASGAWDLAFGLMAEFLWIAAIAAQFMLYWGRSSSVQKTKTG